MEYWNEEIEDYVIEEFIGEIDLTTPRYMIDEAVGKINLKKAGICSIKVYGNEGQIPHFHIENGKGFICCVCIFTPNYFRHKTNESSLSSDQCSILNDFMRSPNKKDTTLTNWEVTVVTWKRSNPNWDGKGYFKNNKIDQEDTTIPTYMSGMTSVH